MGFNSQSFAQLTVPKKFYTDSISFDNAPKRLNDKYPLSDQKNSGKWKKNKKFSDEFRDTKLNTKRWQDFSRGWKGRQPTYFDGRNVTIEDGKLTFKINQHGDDPLPEEYTHSSGYIRSKTQFKYGYFEAKIKAMDAPWVTCFWLTNGTPTWWTEIDICENAPGVAGNEHDLNSNIHVFRSPKDQGDVKKHFSRNGKYYIPFDLKQDYHVWGCEWNEKVIRWYLDGVLFREAENTHWHQPLHIILNNESNKWFGCLPDDNRLDGKYQVEYVRVWQSKQVESEVIQ
ncbi:family 16 glycosylhydrolase [Persicobacter psychrovividus]|uniref:family 16 glycosylhydrolase n=1 Tax=Persicobacter psychrovividus TaxID=387638 RepID=UPI0030CA15B0